MRMCCVSARFEVYATCTLPEPQGPLNIKSGGNVIIPFKNIFPATAPYSFYVDSPYFSLSKTPDTIRAKKVGTGQGAR